MAEPFRVIITSGAAADLAEICGYVEQDSPQNAVAVARRLVTAMDSLDNFPRRYEIHEPSDEPALTVHAMAVPPYIVYYRVDDARRAVRVVAIWHGARRQPKRFK